MFVISINFVRLYFSGQRNTTNKCKKLYEIIKMTDLETLHNFSKDYI